MKWDPQTMMLIDVFRPYGSLYKAGLKSIGRQRNDLTLKFADDSVKIVKPGEEIPLKSIGID